MAPTAKDAGAPKLISRISRRSRDPAGPRYNGHCLQRVLNAGTKNGEKFKNIRIYIKCSVRPRCLLWLKATL